MLLNFTSPIRQQSDISTTIQHATFVNHVLLQVLHQGRAKTPPPSSMLTAHPPGQTAQCWRQKGTWCNTSRHQEEGGPAGTTPPQQAQPLRIGSSEQQVQPLLWTNGAHFTPLAGCSPCTICASERAAAVLAHQLQEECHVDSCYLQIAESH